MRLKEQRLWDAFSSHARGAGLWLQRVENVVMVGMPDVYVGATGAWVELKAPTAPKRATTRLLGDEGLNPDQINWHLKAAATNGGTVSYVLVRSSEGRLFFVPGKFAEHINGMSTDELDAHSFASSWERIIEILKERK